MLDVHEQKFLVLLFVVQPDFNDVEHRRICGGIDKACHLLINMLSIGIDFR